MDTFKLNTIEEAIEDFRQGKIVIVVDDEDRDSFRKQRKFLADIGFLNKSESFVQCLNVESLGEHSGIFLRHGAGAQEGADDGVGFPFQSVSHGADGGTFPAEREGVVADEFRKRVDEDQALNGLNVLKRQTHGEERPHGMPGNDGRKILLLLIENGCVKGAFLILEKSVVDNVDRREGGLLQGVEVEAARDAPPGKDNGLRCIMHESVHFLEPCICRRSVLRVPSVRAHGVYPC